MRARLLSLWALRTLCLQSCLLLELSQAFQCKGIGSREARFLSVATGSIIDTIRSEPWSDAQLDDIIEALESSAKPVLEEDKERFSPLIGLYEVSYVKKTKSGDNPVGGKWTRRNGLAQRILKTRRSFQHILAANTTISSSPSDAVGEAVNVVSLEAFWGILRVTVILRGDAVPLTMEERTNSSRVIQALSPLAIKARFDPPRIAFGRRGCFIINVGPSTSVLLDTTYYDDNVRIGMGGTSGTRFLFVRCPDNDVEANEFRELLSRKPVQKRKAVLVLLALAFSSFYGTNNSGLRTCGRVVGSLSILLGILIASSRGGIEDDDRSVQVRRDEDSGITR